MQYQSVATIDSPEFINLKPLDISPFMSECEIKVLYVGQNRNKSVITKDVATEMAKTLRGNPIVGYFKDDVQDFGDHGRRVVIEDGQIKFEKKTRPYGFISPIAKVWFKKFTEENELGEMVEREYLMTTGYLWTKQFEECQKAVEGEGKGSSMELDEDTLQGNWSKINSGVELFIINDAMISGICLLGDDVEPCFEGSKVSAPEVSANFSLDDKFKYTLFSMMQELRFALEGGNKMEEKILEDFEKVEDKVDETIESKNKEIIDNDSLDSFAKKEDEEKDNEEKSVEESEDEVADEKEANEEEDEDKKKKADYAKKDEPAEEEASNEKAEDDDEDKKKAAQYSLLETELSELKDRYAELEAKYNTVFSAYSKIQEEKKTELINSFYMLSDEDKADVIANKANYSLDDIESKLSVICYRKKVSFANEPVAQKEAVTTFNLDTSAQDNMPEWLKAVNRQKNC